MSPNSRIPQILAEQLTRLRRRLVSFSVAGGIGLTVFVLVLSFLVLMAVDVAVELAPVTRLGLLLLMLCGSLGVALLTIVKPLLRPPSAVELAALIEESNPELDERLLSAMEFAEAAPDDASAGSPVMRDWVLNQTMHFAGTHDFADVADGRRAVRRCWMGGIAVVALVIPLVFAGQAYALLWTRLLNPWGNYERVQNLVLNVENPDRVVGRGDDVTIRVTPSWRFATGDRPESIWLERRTADGAQQRRRLDWSEDENAYSLLLPRVQTSFSYDLSANSARTRQHRITVVDRPEIEQVSLDVVPPAYTGLAARHFDALLGEVTAVEQSDLEFFFRFNKPVQSAEILWLDDRPVVNRRQQESERLADGTFISERTPLALADDQRSATLIMPAALEGPSGRFLVRVKDEFALTSRRESTRRLTIEPDQAPALEFADREQHAAARPQDTLPIPVTASDDFGLDHVELHYEFFRTGANPESGVLTVPPGLRGGRTVQHVFQFNLAPLKLSPGTQVAIRARATDQRPVPGPNESWTGTRIISITREPIPYGEQTLAEQQHRMDQVMEKLRAEIEKQEQAARRLQADAQSDFAREREWQRDEETQAAQEKVNQLEEQMQKLSAVLDQQPLFEQLADESERMARQELSRAQKSLQKAMQSELEQKQDAFSDAAESLKSAAEDFQKMQEKYAELSQMQRDLLGLNQLATNTEQLAEQVDDLVQRQAELPPAGELLTDPARAIWNQDHKRLSERHRQLEGDLEAILDRRPDLLEVARDSLQQNMAHLAEQADQLARTQQALSRAMEQAGREQGDSLKELRQQQEQLLRDEIALAKKLNLPASDKVDVNGAAATRAAQQSMRQGNLQDAQQQHQRAADQLKQLFEALQKNAEAIPDPAALARSLAERQHALAKSAAQLRADTNAATQEEMSRLAGQQAAIRQALDELPVDEKQKSVKTRLAEELKQAAQSLAEHQADVARTKVEQAQQTLHELVTALEAAETSQDEKAADKVRQLAMSAREQAQQIRQQTQELIERQQQVAKQIEAVRKQASQSPQEAPSPESETPEPVSENPSTSVPPTFPSPEAPEESAPSPPMDGKTADATGSQPPAEQPTTTPKEEASRKPNPTAPDLLAQQQALYEQSKALGEELRARESLEEPAKKSSYAFPDAARQVNDALEKLDYQRAAQAAQKSAENARTLAQAAEEQLPELANALRQAAEQQQALAGQFEQLSTSEANQQQFEQELQQSVRQQTGALANAMQARGKELALPRLERQANSQIAGEAAGQAERARQAMTQAAEQYQLGNRKQASQTAKLAVEALRQAAQGAKQSADGVPAHRPVDSVVPGEVGRQVAQSSEFLRQAGDQLSQLGSPSESSSDQTGQTGSEQGLQKSPQQGNQPNEQQNSGQKDGKPGSEPQPSASGSDAAGTLRSAAQEMRQAARQLGIAMSQSLAQQSERQMGQERPLSPSSQAGDEGGDSAVHLTELENALGTVSNRDWGKLPGTLENELMESSQRQPSETYRPLIRRYFEEISKSRPAELSTSPSP